MMLVIGSSLVNFLGSLKIYMVVNLRARRINQSTHKLPHTLMLIKKITYDYSFITEKIKIVGIEGKFRVFLILKI
jgi:hypothetical protein